MRNRIFGAIGVIWGGSILVLTILRGAPEGGGTYGAGQKGGLIFCGLLFCVGMYYLIKGGKKRERKKPNLSTGYDQQVFLKNHLHFASEIPLICSP